MILLRVSRSKKIVHRKVSWYFIHRRSYVIKKIPAPLSQLLSPFVFSPYFFPPPSPIFWTEEREFEQRRKTRSRREIEILNGEIIISGNKIELSRRGRGIRIYIYILNRFVLEIYIGEKEGGRKKKERKKELQRVLRLNLSFLRSSIEPFSPTKFIVLPFPVKVFAEIDLGIKFFFFFYHEPCRRSDIFPDTPFFNYKAHRKSSHGVHGANVPELFLIGRHLTPPRRGKWK